MEGPIGKVLEKVPEMLALIILVKFFLSAQSESRKEFLSAFTVVHTDNISQATLTREIIKDCAKSNYELIAAVKALENRLGMK